jgi:hypothetical protein
VVEGNLLGGVAVALVRSSGLCAIQPEGIAAARAVLLIQEVRILIQQLRCVAIDRRRSAQRLEARFAGRVQRMWVCAEVMVEGDVLLKDDDDVANGMPRAIELRAMRRQHGCERQGCCPASAELSSHCPGRQLESARQRH